MQNGNNYEDNEGIKAIEMDLLKTEWVDEAKQIPIYELPETERDILIKCINMEDMTDNEVSQLKSILNRFRKPIREQKPNETLQNAKDNLEHTKSVQEYIKILKESKKSTIYPIMYPVTDDIEEEIPLSINKELTPEATRLISNLQTNLTAFVDYTEDERDSYTKYEKGEELTEEELLIAKKIESELIKVGAQNFNEIRQTAIEFLAVQTRIAYDENCTYEDMLDFYSEMKNNILTALFEEIQEVLGVNSIDRDKIFRKFN